MDASATRVGSTALHARRGARLALRDFGDVPLVLAFARAWAPERESAHHLDAIRAELRGLGAVLVVVTGDGAWSFRPDDDVERSAPGGVELDDAIARLVRAHGIARDDDGDSQLAVFVLDGRGAVRFARGPIDDATEIGAALVDALAAAGRALTARPPPATVSRRELVVASLVAGFVLALGEGCSKRAAPVTTTGAAASSGASPPTAGEMDVVLHVNGADRTVRIDARTSLLDALRERMGLTGTKKGCDHGQCGACTVLVDDRRVCSCLTLAVMAQGSKVTTIEGLAQGDRLHPVQEAFIAADGFQCGYCTPGQILSAVALIAEGHAQSDDDVREQMSGNLCRCGAYPNIVAAIQLARKKGA